MPGVEQVIVSSCASRAPASLGVVVGTTSLSQEISPVVKVRVVVFGWVYDQT